MGALRLLSSCPRAEINQLLIDYRTSKIDWGYGRVSMTSQRVLCERQAIGLLAHRTPIVYRNLPYRKHARGDSQRVLKRERSDSARMC